MGDWLGITCMFLNGFVMLTPHRIAMLCANHVIKRFHFPQCTVPLFIYKIHTPMELASLTSTFLANVVTWVSDAAFSDGDKKMKFKRIISCIAIWIMFLTSVVSYFLFISDEEYGNFELFYWSVVSITFANGFSSNFGFGVNFNSTMYGAGIPASSFVTFIVHKSYNYFYNKYFWDEYDYRLVVVQYYFTMFSLGLTGALWTWDQVMQINTGPPPTPTIQVDISQIPDGVGKTTTYTDSSSNKVKVKYQNQNVAGFQFYIHTLAAGGKFTLKKDIKINSQQSNNTATLTSNDIQNFYEVYYYKKSNAGALKVKTSSETKVYAKNSDVTQTTGSWLQYNDNSSTDNNTFSNLTDLFSELKSEDEIKIEKTTTGYGFKKTNGTVDNITVASETVGTGKLGVTDYKCYKHTLQSGMNIKKIRYNDTLLLGFDEMQSVTAVYVYYKSEDEQYKRPLLVYFEYNTNNHKVYGRGTDWRDMNITGTQNQNEPSANGLEPHLDKMVRQGTFKELIYFDNGYHWSPILMLTFSLGTIYAFYPMISPYSLIDPERAEKIDLWIAVTCAIPNFVLAVMDTMDAMNPNSGHGPGAKWEKDDNVNREYYHYVWIIGGVPYLICLYVFFTTLHFPEGFIGRHVKDNPYVVGFFSVTFNTVQELMESTGFGGGDKQSYDGFVGSINQFSVLLMLITCVCTMFPCDGYLK